MVYFDRRAILPKISYFAANDFSIEIESSQRRSDASDLSAETLRKIR